VSQTVGVISVPEIKLHNIDPSVDVFMVWATDGVWEFIDDQTAVDIVETQRKANLEKSMETLVDAAVKKWQQEEEVVDDITCKCCLQEQRSLAHCSQDSCTLCQASSSISPTASHLSSIFTIIRCLIRDCSPHIRPLICCTAWQHSCVFLFVRTKFEDPMRSRIATSNVSNITHTSGLF